MRKTGIAFLLALSVAVLTPLSSLTVKLGSMFPEGTEWDNSLKRVAAEWEDITGGEVRMRIYSSGVADDEYDMVRKVRLGQLDACTLTSVGLKAIVPNTFVMSLPGMLKSQEELEIVIDQFAPKFESDFVREGFRVLVWSNNGWANFYAKNPATTPDLLRKEKLSVSKGDFELAESFKALDFNVIPISMNEVMVGLQSGMASAFLAPPITAATFQWFSVATHLIDFPVVPVIGGLVISERTWKRIPARYHASLKASIEGVAKDFGSNAARLNAESLKVMIQNGLIIEELSEEIKDEWYELLIQGHSLVVGEGKWIDIAVYEELIFALNEIR